MPKFNIFQIIDKVHTGNQNDESHLKNVREVLKGGMEIQPNQYNINNISSKDSKTIGSNLGSLF